LGRAWSDFVIVVVTHRCRRRLRDFCLALCSVARRSATAIRPFSRSEGKPVVQHALRGKSIGGIESTLACPGTKLEHTPFFSTVGFAIVIVIVSEQASPRPTDRRSRFCCGSVLFLFPFLSLSFFLSLSLLFLPNLSSGGNRPTANLVSAAAAAAAAGFSFSFSTLHCVRSLSLSLKR
jgi:hypothetical protein